MNLNGGPNKGLAAHARRQEETVEPCPHPYDQLIRNAGRRLWNCHSCRDTFTDLEARFHDPTPRSLAWNEAINETLGRKI